MKYSDNMVDVQEAVVFDFLSRIRSPDVTEELTFNKRKVFQCRRDFMRACNDVLKSMKANERAWQTKLILGNAYDVATELFRLEDEIRDLWCSSPTFDENAYQEYQDDVFLYRKKWLRLWTSAWMYIFEKNERFMRINGKQQGDQQPGEKKKEIYVMTPNFASQKFSSSVGLLFPVAVAKPDKAEPSKENRQPPKKSEQQPDANADEDQKTQSQQQKAQKVQKEDEEQKPNQKEAKPKRAPKTEQEPASSSAKEQPEQNNQQDPVQPNKKLEEMIKEYKSGNTLLEVKVVGGKVVGVKLNTPPRADDLRKCELPPGGMELDITDIGNLENGVIAGYKADDPRVKRVFDVLPQKMAEFCKTDIGKTPFTPAETELCIVQLPQGQHLRAIFVRKVTGPGGPLALVKYIDYGHSERVPLTYLRRIPRQFVKKYPAAAADLTIQNFPKAMTSEMIIKAAAHMQVPGEGKLRLEIEDNEKIAPGTYTIQAPGLLKAMTE